MTGLKPKARSRTLPRFVAALAIVSLDAGIGACAWSATNGPSGSTTLVVQQNSALLARFALSQLMSLPQVEVVTPQSRGAQVQKGPTVGSVLNAAAAADVDRVRVEGRDPAQTLTAAELNAPVILSVTKRNTLKLAGARLDTGRWVRDVTTLIVNP